jgi:hypothetical protein
MSACPEFGVYSLAGTPVSATTGGSSATLALPNAADGTPARWVYIATVAGSAYIRPVQTGGTVAAGAGFPITTAGAVFNVRGFTHIAHIQITGAQTLVVVPLEV